VQLLIYHSSFFLVIFAIIGGNLFWVMFIVVPLMILPGILVQTKLAQLAQEGMRESSIRNAILVEAVQGLKILNYYVQNLDFKISGII
jgi:ABC-type bacteriocin/lantibiotic exporter with double-glycine peptidase domain